MGRVYMESEYNLELPGAPAKDPLNVRLLRRARRLLGKVEPESSATGWPSMPYPTAELVYWRPGGRVNFGDELSRTIVELMLGRRGATIYDEVEQRRRLLAIGSILHFANNNSVVWGSGVNGSVPEDDHTYIALDVRAVRGPLTRKFLSRRGIDVPEVYGDPGLLVKFLTGDRFGTSKTGKSGFVPHMADFQSQDFSRVQDSKDITIIDPQRSWNVVIDEIASCDFVVSSSLHGLIVADAFGIPSIYVRLSNHEGLLKYQDYYAGTGRSLQFVETIDEAFKHQGCEQLQYDPAALLAAFPYDIWEKATGVTRL